MGAQFSQFFPGSPNFTETNVPSQKGKVFLITGGYSGIGLELAKILYQKGGKVYIAGRSQEKAQQAIQNIQAFDSEGGSLHFLALELDDLSTIAESVEAFKKKETNLDVLWNNAGVSQPPLGSQSKQGIELQLATNCLGPFLFTQLLLPLLEAATSAESQGSASASARVVWSSSQIMELSAPKGGIIMSEVKEPPKDKTRNYVNSKTGNYLLSCELARREGAAKSLISVSLNPGAATTHLFRHTPLVGYLAWPLLHKPKLAAYTLLYAGISPDITIEGNGAYVVPWGRVAKTVRQDLVDAAKTKDEGGTGVATKFWSFCEELTHEHLR